MRQYLQLLEDVLTRGELLPTRARLASTGQNVSAYTLFGAQTRYNLQAGFPLVTTKKASFHSIKIELLWFLMGETNVRWLQEHNCSIWDEWADENGELGPVYGKQWRSWGDGVDQIKGVEWSLRHDPYGRRHLVSAWNVSDLRDMALPPCHLLFQFHVSKDKRLSCQLYQRSADIFLGVPYNIASYALLTCMLAQVLGYEPGDFIHTIGNVHLYENHVEQAKEQLTRTPKAPPRLMLTPQTSVLHYKPEHIALEEYASHPAIRAEVAI